MGKFKIVSDYKMMGDQPQAVKTLVDGIKRGKRSQTLMGVTGSGKTFTMANPLSSNKLCVQVIAHYNPCRVVGSPRAGATAP